MAETLTINGLFDGDGIKDSTFTHLQTKDDGNTCKFGSNDDNSEPIWIFSTPLASYANVKSLVLNFRATSDTDPITPSFRIRTGGVGGSWTSVKTQEIADGGLADYQLSWVVSLGAVTEFEIGINCGPIHGGQADLEFDYIDLVIDGVVAASTANPAAFAMFLD